MYVCVYVCVCGKTMKKTHTQKKIKTQKKKKEKKNTKFSLKWPRNEVECDREGYKGLCLSLEGPMGMCDELMGISFITILHDLAI